MLSPAQIVLLRQAALSAVEGELAAGIPAELTVAQWALESKWGSRQPGNNCFGIKAYPGCFGMQLLQTFEVVKGVRVPMLERFATFPSLAACFAKHASLFTSGKPYAKAWAQYCESRNLEAFIRQVAAIYATDPHYAEILLKIIAMSQVRECLAESRNRPAPVQGSFS
jgi:flagellum-specific peptidoglycan hydrolase FlgJ